MKLRSIIAALTIAAASVLQIPTAVAVQTLDLAGTDDASRQAQQRQVEERMEQLLAKLLLINGPYVGDTGEFRWAVERWRPFVADYFPEDRIDWALRIIQCESGGDPLAKNPTSTASGLFQHLASLWEERAAKAGWADSDVFDPLANIAVAAWLLETGGPGHWVCTAAK